MLESNEVCRAIVQQCDLRQLIIRPVDTDEIHEEIDCLERRHNVIDEKLEDLDSLKEELSSLEERKRELESEVRISTISSSLMRRCSTARK
ncbi:hypothetical protein [Natrinema sp. DC36]|uniref:hypothetical protein n=1 Tax=Natrinema sp. DC36 TaxID=2878680 RepID=UPI001CF01039|nr:hypothetical protein [Natrinema sp. DC36]